MIPAEQVRAIIPLFTGKIFPFCFSLPVCIPIITSLRVIEESGKQNKLAFTKTRETQTTSTARLGSATMGIMPDYTFSGTGVRVDGVTDNRPAQKAGLKAGDIIVQLGEYNTNSMENYMQALSKFKKGDKTKVKYKRGNDVLESEVVF